MACRIGINGFGRIGRMVLCRTLTMPDVKHWTRMNDPHPTWRARQRQANFRGVLIREEITKQYQAKENRIIYTIRPESETARDMLGLLLAGVYGAIAARRGCRSFRKPRPRLRKTGLPDMPCE
jgi:hypothetical protein